MMTDRYWYVVGESVPGVSHQKGAIPCQDEFTYRNLPGGVAIIAVADGAGSAKHAQQGARLAVEKAVALLEQAINEQHPQDETKWRCMMETTFEQTHQELVNHAASQDVSPRSFATTLSCVVATCDHFVMGQIGDGVVVTEDSEGALLLPIAPQRGEYTNETFFLTLPNVLEYVQIVVQPAPRAFAMATDSLLRLALHLPSYEPSPQFFCPLFAFMASSDDAIQAQADLKTFLSSERIAARTDDDTTLVLAIRKTVVAEEHEALVSPTTDIEENQTEPLQNMSLESEVEPSDDSV